MRGIANLDEIILYRHPQVIKRFAKDYPEMSSHAEMIFEDLMRFFWVSKHHEEEKKLHPTKDELAFLYIMDEEMKGIDQMWHIFLLYTKDYAAFCQMYFGEFLHHFPDLVDPADEDVEKFTLNLEKFLNYTYNQLGEEVIRRWYAPILNEKD